jgi:hypothetical protein
VLITTVMTLVSVHTSYKGAEQENRAPLQEGATESGYIFYC